MTWVGGSGSVSRIRRLSSAFQEGQVAHFNRKYSFDCSHYHPCMWLSQIFPKSNALNIVSLSSPGTLVDTDPEYFKLFNHLINQQKHLGSISDKNGAIVLRDQISTTELQDFNREIGSALDLIKSSVPWLYQLFACLIVKVHPVFRYNAESTHWSASDYYLIGLIFSSKKDSENFPVINQAITLAHELAHNVTFLLEAGSPSINEAYQFRKVYSGIRKVDRPLRGSLHALIALGYMLVLLRSFLTSGRLSDSESDFCRAKIGDYERNLDLGLRAMDDRFFTDNGRLMIADVRMALIGKL